MDDWEDMPETIFTPSGVRLRKHSTTGNGLNWLLLPGGPGIGSESLDSLASALTVAGSIWLVDLPGDGSNRAAPGAADDPYSLWPKVVAEAARVLPNVVFVGHSTGGMYLLATPELETLIEGLVLLDTAPDAEWHTRFVKMTEDCPLPEVQAAMEIYERDKCDENIAAFAIATAQWNFSAAGLEAGRKLLAAMPYNNAAVEWSETHFDHTYRAKWWPRSIPVLILAGAEDRIVWQGGWDDERFRTPNVIVRSAADAGHFPWIENPVAVDAAFAELTAVIFRNQQ
jgi:pimeloyl-ACP methyl ester carboxylesterase